MKNLSLKPIAFMLAFICMMIACEEPNDAVAPTKKNLSGAELSQIVNGMSSFQNLITLIDQRSEELRLKIESLSADDYNKLVTIYKKHSNFNNFIKNASSSEKEFLILLLESSKTVEIRSNFTSLVNDLSDKYFVNYRDFSGVVASVNRSGGANGKVNCVAIANESFWDAAGEAIDSGSTPEKAYFYGNLAYSYAYIGCIKALTANPQ